MSRARIAPIQVLLVPWVVHQGVESCLVIDHPRSITRVAAAGLRRGPEPWEESPRAPHVLPVVVAEALDQLLFFLPRADGQQQENDRAADRQERIGRDEADRGDAQAPADVERVADPAVRAG